MRTRRALAFLLICLQLILSLQAALAEWDDLFALEEDLEEEEIIEAVYTAPPRDVAEESGETDFSLDPDFDVSFDLDDFSLSMLASDEDLEPMSEEELLRVLAEQEETDFLVIPEDSQIADTDLYTLLLIGTDAYEEDKRGRADTTILVQINAEKKTIKMVSFLRDMYVAIPGRSSNRLNAAYIWGGDRLIRRTLRNNFGVEADAYMEVNFARLIRIIDAIGGIEVDVTEEEQRQVNSILRFYNTYTGDKEEDQLLWDYGEGVHLTGKQALCFARIRKIDNDFARTERQRKVIEAAYHKVMGLSLTEMTRLVTENLDAVTTDLSLGDVIRLIPMAIRCSNAEISTMTVPYPGTYTVENVSGMSVIVPNIRTNRNRLRTFLAAD
ncbi:MAG: LCP family protein [Clostridia bacterium]|nr:LCP family protein [Clostridia bacterium]